MTNKELIKHVVVKLDEEYRALIAEGTTQQAKEADLVVCVLQKLKSFIDSLPEESGCEANFITKNEDLEEAEGLEEAMELSVSEEPLLEFFATGQPTIGAYNKDSLRNQFEAGAEWQKQQMKEVLQTEYEKGRFDMREEMMKDAVEGEITLDINGNIRMDCADVFYVGDKVKIIPVKPEQQ